jgi:abortive infection bacteriophage resistance protein
MTPLPGSVARPYLKPALASSDLLAHLVARGLSIPDKTKALQSLEHIGYYRLLIYMRPLQSASKQFHPGLLSTRFSRFTTLIDSSGCSALTP